MLRLLIPPSSGSPRCSNQKFDIALGSGDWAFDQIEYCPAFFFEPVPDLRADVRQFPSETVTGAPRPGAMQDELAKRRTRAAS